MERVCGIYWIQAWQCYSDLPMNVIIKAIMSEMVVIYNTKSIYQACVLCCDIKILFSKNHRCRWAKHLILSFKGDWDSMKVDFIYAPSVKLLWSSPWTRWPAPAGGLIWWLEVFTTGNTGSTFSFGQDGSPSSRARLRTTLIWATQPIHKERENTNLKVYKEVTVTKNNIT